MVPAGGPGQVTRLRGRIARLQALLRECLEVVPSDEVELRERIARELDKTRRRRGSDG